MGIITLEVPVPSSHEYEQIRAELIRWCQPRGRKRQLSREMGVSHSLVNLWLSGERKLSLEQWIAIQKIIRPKESEAETIKKPKKRK
jgi:DNA-binding transcriptional regulator YdaS (Cro superfamily)